MADKTKSEKGHHVPKPARKPSRGPVEHIYRIPMTENESVELETVATLERSTLAETVRRAVKDYAEKKRQG